MIHRRIVAIACLAALAAGPAASQTVSGGGTRALAGAMPKADLKGEMPGGRPVKQPADAGLGTAVPSLGQKSGITSSTIGGGTGQGSGGAGVGVAPQTPNGGGTRPPQPPTPCPAGKTLAFSDALNAWFCL